MFSLNLISEALGFNIEYHLFFRIDISILHQANQKFVRATNWQSRTALAIMPPLFTFGFTAEMKLGQSMEEMAAQAKHSKEVTEWAQNIHEENKHALQRKETDAALEKKLHALYKQSVEESGVRIVPGDTLSLHHRIANFWQENPFKILALKSRKDGYKKQDHHCQQRRCSRTCLSN